MARTTQSNNHNRSHTSLLHDQRGLSTVEYIIILVLIAIAGLVGWQKIGKGVTDRIEGSNTTIRSDLPVPTPGEGGD